MSDQSEHIEIYAEDGSSRGFYSEKNKLNDLTGKEWVFATRSVIPKSYPPSYQHALRNQHGGQKPPELCAELIQMFTKKGGLVLDPMMGVGGTLLGASICNRIAVGIEIEQRWIDIYRQVCLLEKMEPQSSHCGNAIELLPTLSCEFDFILTDVPYWNMDTAKRSNGKFKRVGQQSEPNKLKKNLNRFNQQTPPNKEEWLKLMQSIFQRCLHNLKKDKYMAVFVGDMYQNGRYHHLGAELAQALEEIGWTMKANIIWYDPSKQLHVYGYRYAFIPSLTHQNILILRKE